MWLWLTISHYMCHWQNLSSPIKPNNQGHTGIHNSYKIVKKAPSWSWSCPISTNRSQASHSLKNFILCCSKNVLHKCYDFKCMHHTWAIFCRILRFGNFTQCCLFLPCGILTTGSIHLLMPCNELYKDSAKNTGSLLSAYPVCIFFLLKSITGPRKPLKYGHLELLAVHVLIIPWHAEHERIMCVDVHICFILHAVWIGQTNTLPDDKYVVDSYRMHMHIH